MNLCSFLLRIFCSWMSICADRSFRRGSQDLHLNGDTILHLLPIVFLCLCILFFFFQFFSFASSFLFFSLLEKMLPVLWMPFFNKTVKWKKSKYLCNQAHQLYSHTSQQSTLPCFWCEEISRNCLFFMVRLIRYY